jgi:hypothetical protein
MKSFICFVHNVVINLPIYFNSYMLLSCDFMYLYRIVVNVSITFFLCVSLYIFFRGSYYSIFSFICMFCRSLFVLLYFFSFGHCVVCSSSIYRFWLPLWYLVFIVLSVLLRYTDSDYSFGILKLFYWLWFFYIYVYIIWHRFQGTLATLTPGCSSFLLTTFLFCLVDVFFSRQSVYLWVQAVLLFSPTCSFIRMRQTSYRGF